MSDRPANASPDWRRQPRQRRRGSDQIATVEPDPEVENGSGEAEPEVTASRTLFSFLEPGLNTIGTFGAPMVFAGIVGLIVGIVLIFFVGSLRLYGFVTIGVGVVLIGLVALISLSAVFAAFISREMHWQDGLTCYLHLLDSSARMDRNKKNAIMLRK